MKIMYCAATLMAVAIASPALANNVSGARAEAIVGWDNVGVDLEDFGLGDGSRGGVLFGLGLGYDFGVGERWSIGIDAEIADSTTDLEITDGVDSAKVSVGRDLYVGGRLTTAVSDKVNLYVKAGYTNARIKASATIGGVTESDAANGDGIRAGVGAQYYVNSSVYLGAEYRYSNYEADFTRNQIAATLGLRF